MPRPLNGFSSYTRRLSVGAAAAFLLAAGILVQIASAADAVKGAAGQPPQGSAAPATPAAPLPAYDVDGFRSARFGMTEAEVRKAIAADFKIAEKGIVQDTNSVEQTAILSVTVPDLLAGAGPAHVSYVFGYAHRRLISVVVVWAEKKSGTGNALAGPAAALENYYLGYKFQPEGLLRDVALKDGSVLLFQGADTKGRTVSLVTGETAVAQGASASGEHQWYLRLSYLENPKQLDIYRIKAGAF